MSDRRCLGGGLRKVARARSHLRDGILFSRALGSTRRSRLEAKFDSERVMMAAMSPRGPSLVYNKKENVVSVKLKIGHCVQSEARSRVAKGFSLERANHSTTYLMHGVVQGFKVFMLML